MRPRKVRSRWTSLGTRRAPCSAASRENWSTGMVRCGGSGPLKPCCSTTPQWGSPAHSPGSPSPWALGQAWGGELGGRSTGAKALLCLTAEIDLRWMEKLFPNEKLSTDLCILYTSVSQTLFYFWVFRHYLLIGNRGPCVTGGG